MRIAFLFIAVFTVIQLTGQLVISSLTSGFYTDSIWIEFDFPPSFELKVNVNSDGPISEGEVYDQGFYLYENENLNKISEIPTNPSNSSINHVWIAPSNNIKKANIVKYLLYDGDDIIESGSYTYFIGDYGYKYPVLSIIIDSLSLFDYENGIYIPGKLYDDNPNLWQPGNYYSRGRAWERNAFIQYFVQENLELQADIGVRLHGGGSRIMPMKSLRLYARNEYGTPSLAYPFFKDRAAEDYKRLILRNGGQDFTKGLIRDGLAHQLCKNLNVEYQSVSPTIVYINGAYWGIHNMRERYDEYYFKDYHNEHKDAIDLIEIQMAIDIDQGSDIQYLEFVEFYTKNDLSNSANYEMISKMMDVSNYIDYHISKIFMGNVDWPGNNTKIWKPQAEGYKWRWAISDYDDGFKNIDYNSFQHSIKADGQFWPNPDWSTLLFRKLLENPTFKSQYQQRLTQLIENDFSIGNTIPVLTDIVDDYRPHIAEHIERWNYPVDSMSWIKEIESIESFLKQRGEVILNQYDQILSVISTQSQNFKIYPNPAVETITIDYKFKPYSYIIFDSNGKIIKKSTFVHQVDVQDLQHGSYILVLLDVDNMLIGNFMFCKV